MYDGFQGIAGIPNIVGCLGATHIAIKCPAKCIADRYLNEDNTHSFCVMVSFLIKKTNTFKTKQANLPTVGMRFGYAVP